jgi:hypothetical protein
MHPTPYRELNELLATFLVALRAILGNELVGLYLHGSLAGGDFVPERSDVDFVAVTQGVLVAETVAAVATLHERLAAGGCHWAAELEGSYFPLAAVRCYDPGNAGYPHVERYGKLRVEQHDSDWILQLHVLREHGVALAGPAPRTLIDPIDAADLRRASRETLRQWWLPQLDDTHRLEESGYRAYGILTMCRILYTLAHGEVVSKPVAARWLQNEAPEWAPLVTQALRWQPGEPLGYLEETLAFIRYTLQQSEELDGA